MRITSLRASPFAASSRAVAGPAAASGGNRFSIPDEAARQVAPARLTAEVAAVASLLDLQAVEDPQARMRRAIGQGRDMLDLLDEVKLMLLEGRVSDAVAARLERAIAAREPDAGEPGLTELIDQIELRARVELAKLRPSAV